MVLIGTVFGGTSVRISAETGDLFTEEFRDFSQPPQENTGIITRAGYESFFPIPFQQIVHQSSYNSTLYIPR
jgi:hypothetical protein